MHAGHTSVGRVLDPAARLLALATACLLPAAIALYTGSERVAIVAGVLAITAYYIVVLRSEVATRFRRASGAPP